MHDAGARQQFQVWIVMQQGIHQGAAGIAGTGMDHQPRRLVQHDQVLVLVQDVQRNGFGRGAGLHFQHRVQGDGLAAKHGIPRAHRGPVQQHITGFDPACQPRARVLGEQFRKHLVQPPAGS